MRHGMVMNTSDSKMTDSPSLDDAILSVLARDGTKTLSPPEIAHAIANGDDWHGLLVPIRKSAVALAQAGRLVIYRKGKPVDPNAVKGVIRLRLPTEAETAAAVAALPPAPQDDDDFI